MIGGYVTFNAGIEIMNGVYFDHEHEGGCDDERPVELS